MKAHPKQTLLRSLQVPQCDSLFVRYCMDRKGSTGKVFSWLRSFFVQQGTLYNTILLYGTVLGSNCRNYGTTAYFVSRSTLDTTKTHHNYFLFT